MKTRRSTQVGWTLGTTIVSIALVLSGCGAALPTNTPAPPGSTVNPNPAFGGIATPTPTLPDNVLSATDVQSGGGGGGGSRTGNGPPGSPFDGALTSGEQEAAYVAHLRGQIEGKPDGWWMRLNQDVYAYLGRKTEPGGPPGGWFVVIHDVVTHEGVNVKLDGTVMVSGSVDIENRFGLVAIAGQLANATEQDLVESTPPADRIVMSPVCADSTIFVGRSAVRLPEGVYIESIGAFDACVTDAGCLDGSGYVLRKGESVVSVSFTGEIDWSQMLPEDAQSFGFLDDVFR